MNAPKKPPTARPAPTPVTRGPAPETADRARPWLWAVPPLAVIVLVALVLGSDGAAWLAWQAVLFVMAALALPVAVRLFAAVPRAALAFAFPLGVALVSAVVWTGAHLRLLPFNGVVTWLVAVALAVAVWLPKRWRREVAHVAGQPGVLAAWSVTGVVFASAGGLWTFVRGTMPRVEGLEKFMNLGFMNSLWRTEWLPANDMWLSGETINYYYYGQYAYTMLSKMAGLPPFLSYNLALASTLAFVATGVVGLGLALFGLAKATPGVQWIGSAVMVFLVAFAGNAHAFFYAGPGKPVLGLLSAMGVDVGETDSFFFTNSTRFIGHNPDVPTDRTIAEFPYYSFLVADLHAHVVNTMFVLLLLGVLVAWLARPVPAPDEQPGEGASARDRLQDGWASVLLEVAHSPWLLTAGLLLGLMAMANYWDFVIYYVVVVMVLVVGGLRHRAPGSGLDVAVGVAGVGATLAAFLGVGQPVALLLVLIGVAVGLSAAHGLLGGLATRVAATQASVFALAHLVALAFNNGFEPISKEIALVTGRSAPWQLLVMWGPITLVTVGSAIWLLRRARRAEATAPGPWGRLAVPDAAALVLVVAGLGLLAAPEVLFVKDIYIATNPRANTMFKFTFQAFIMLGLAAGYGVVRILTAEKRSRRTQVLGGVLAAALVMPAWYPFVATFQWVPKSLDYIGIDGAAWLGEPTQSTRVAGEATNYGPTGDLAAITWLNENVSGDPVILEADGPSYTHFNRISSYTGLPTVLGWETHEWLWRTSEERPQARDVVVVPRQQDIQKVYEATDPAAARSILATYGVRYLVVGELERLRYPGIDEAVLRQFGSEAFSADGTTIIRVG